MTLQLDKDLFQDMVAFYGNLYGLAPLSAKVLVYLLFDFKREGVTFEELTDTLRVSKSSLSGSLQTLVQNKHVEYVTGIDSRKRLYRTDPDYVYIRFSEVLDNLTREKSLISRLKGFQTHLGCEKEFVSEKLNEYTEILDEHISTLTTTLHKLKNN